MCDRLPMEYGTHNIDLPNKATSPKYVLEYIISLEKVGACFYLASLSWSMVLAQFKQKFT